jgi:hypothetical protein
MSCSFSFVYIKYLTRFYHSFVKDVFDPTKYKNGLNETKLNIFHFIDSSSVTGGPATPTLH